MDIHKPKAAHSVREFLVEIGTITVGILIALGLESAIEGHRHHELVARVRIDLRQELQADRAILARTIADEKALATSLASVTRYARDKMRGHPSTLPPDARLAMTFVPLSTAGWESAVATQALVHMPYDEAHVVTQAYAGTRVYNQYQDEAARRWIELSGEIDDLDIASPDELRSAVRQLGLSAAYQATLIPSGEHLLRHYDRALASLR